MLVRRHDKARVALQENASDDRWKGALSALCRSCCVLLAAAGCVAVGARGSAPSRRDPDPDCAAYLAPYYYQSFAAFRLDSCRDPARLLSGRKTGALAPQDARPPEVPVLSGGSLLKKKNPRALFLVDIRYIIRHWRRANGERGIVRSRQ